MNDLLAILAHDILPIFVVIGLGFAAGRRFLSDARMLSRLALYVLSPCLIFSLLVSSSIGGDELARIVAFTVVSVGIMGLLGRLTAYALRLDAHATAGVMLVSMFVNAGNYGLGLEQRAFGEDALVRAVIYFTTSTFMVYTVGISIAAGSDGNGLRSAVRRVFQVPPVYAVLAALIVRALSIDVTHPAVEPVYTGIRLAAQAAIPVMLMVLGVQLAQAPVAQHLRPALVVSALRLAVAPIVASLIAGLMGLTGAGRQATIVEASMPAAVINIILATEYRAAPELVTGVVVVSTLLSPFTLSLIILRLK